MFTISVLVIHAVWSAAIPILLTELLFPDRRTTPYLGRGGLVGTSICYVLGVALLWFVAHVSFVAGFEASPILPGLAVLAALALGVVALRVLPSKAPRPRLPFNAPQPWGVLLVIGSSGFTWQASQFLWAIQPLFSDWPLVLVPLVSTLLIGGEITWLLSRWSRARNWGDLHLLAVASGAVLCHILIGLLAYTQTTTDRIGLALLGLAMMGWLTWLAFRLHRRSFSQDRSVQKREEALPVSEL